MMRATDWLGGLTGKPRPRSVALALPGLIAIGAGVVMTVFEGGFTPNAWYPAGLLLLVLLLLVTAAEAPRRLSPGSPAGLILIAYAAFVVFNYLSILWAAVPADAWAGANRALVFGLALALTATRPWSRDAGLAALALTGFGLLAVAVGTLAVGALGDPLRQFVEGRLSDPTGYANATAALCLMGAFPLLYLAAARALAWPLRGVALGGATTLVQVALLTQSRGAVVGLAVAGIVYLILVPQRWASLLCAGVVAALTALSFGVLTDLIDVGTATRFEARLDDARAAIALSAAVATALGAAGALVGVRLPTPGKALRRAGNWGLGAVAVGLAVAALVAIGSPGNWVDERWDDFRNSGYSKVDRGGSRFGGSLGSNRYDYYRVALDEFERHPVGGIGSENFLVPYLQQRRSTEAPHFPHSLAFRLLVQFGLVGTLSFSAFLGLALFGLGRALRRSRRVDTGICAAAFAVFAVWFAHGMVDWLWAFTGLGVIAFALLGVAIRCGDRARVGSAEAASAPGRQGLRRLTGAAALAFAAAVAVSLSLPWLAARYESAAYDSFAAGDVDLALDRFDRAAAMNFLSGEPLVAKGIVARRGGRPTVAIEAFEQGIGREHDNWLAHLELGMSLAAQGHRRRAETQIEIARRLNPGQVVLKRVLRLVEAGQTLNPAEVERDLNRQLTDNFRPL
jgi:tetratricopeptide (TPR) repeat protein